jgi:PAS domain S-box-containing protein/putative nucleotidyltransferase with HDIG domain
MSRDLAVLIVEDVESDAELAIRWLKKAGHEVVYARVESASQLKDAVEEQAWDVIIADYSLPQFSAPAALKLLQETGLDIPFIVVSGTIGEEIAVAMMKAGAHDYLLKDNLARLAPAIERELDQAQVRHARKQMEEERDITVQLLRLLSEKNDEHELMRQVTNLLHTWSGCEAIGIRLQNGDDFPYFETSGFPARFVKLESSLCAKDAAGNLLRDRQGNPVLECMCGNVLCSRTDPGKPFFTAHGSFWSNCTTQLLATTTDEDRQAHTRNRCNGAGYESVALIPLRAAGITYGLVQLNDFREGRFTPERIALFERLADTIASGLAERLAQKTLQESEARYRAVALSANDAIITSDVADKIVGWNLSAQRIFGYTEDEILGQPVTMLLTQMYSERHRLGMEKMPITGVENILGKTIEGEGQRKDGSTFPLELSLSAWDIREDRFYTAIVHDITARKQAEAMLHLQSAALTAAANAIMITDRQGLIEWVNPSFTTLTGYARPEALGKNSRELVNSGQHDKAFYKNMWETILAGRVWQGEIINCRKNGEAYCEEMTITPLQDDHGEVSHFIAIKQDITPRKKADEQIRRQLQRLAALRTIDAAITSSLDLTLTLNIILRETLTQLNVDAATILLINPALHMLEYATGIGLRTDSMKHPNLRLGEGLAGRAALERRVIHVPDLFSADTEFTQLTEFAAEQFVGYCVVPLISKGEVNGVLEVYKRSVLSLPSEDVEWRYFLETLAGQAAIAVDNVRLFDHLQRANMELFMAYDATIEGWSRAMDLRDRETEGHTQRVTKLTETLARAIGFNDTELIHTRRGALLHDIGKMGVPDHILLKPNKLTAEEWEMIRCHPSFAYEMLSPINYLRPALDIPYCHHEKWDGTGYPRGLKGEEIPLPARLFAVVDVWDALTNDRPYRKAWPKDKTLAYIREQSGTHFDPQVIQSFLEIITAEPPGKATF